MNKYQAKEILEREQMTWGDVVGLLRKARKSDMDFTKRSVVNKTLTKGVAFNIFWKGIQSQNQDELVSRSRVAFVAANVLREFGEAAGYKATRDRSKDLGPPSHQDPMEID